MTSWSRSAAAAALMPLGAASVSAAPNAAPNPWLKYPSRAQYRAVWPAEATKEKTGGRAIVRCHVDSAGLLSACRVINETPSGSGFGQALTSLYQLKPEAIATEAPDGEVTLHSNWFEFDKGVGQAALALASRFRVTTWPIEGLPTVGGTINIPVHYQAGAPAPVIAKP